MSKTSSGESDQKYVYISDTGGTKRYYLTEVLETEEETLDDHYVASSSYPADKQSDQINVVADKPDQLLKHQEVELENTLRGSTKTIQAYVSWHDAAIKNSRPDPSFTVYRKVEITDPITGAVTGTTYELYLKTYSLYMETVDDNPYFQKVIIDGLDKYDENGKEYEYYIAEKLVNAIDDYADPVFYDYAHVPGSNNLVLQDGPAISESSGITFKDVREIGDVSEKKQSILVNGVETEPEANRTSVVIKKEDGSEESVFLVQENGVIMNDTYSYITVTGTKQWLNIPYMDPSKLPNAEIYLFGSSTYDEDHKLPEGLNVVAKTEDEKAEVNKLNLAWAKTELSTDKTKYRFDEAVDSETELIRFPKYDRYGALYSYSVYERIIPSGATTNVSGWTSALAGYIMEGSTINFNLVNNYHDGSEENGYNKRTISVSKNWHGIEESKLVKLPNAKFYLYRIEVDEETEIGADGFPVVGSAITNVSNLPSGAEYVATKTLEYAKNTANRDGEIHLAKWSVSTKDAVKEQEYWPIYAPSGKIYIYYILESMTYAPSYTPKCDENSKIVKKIEDTTVNGDKCAVFMMRSLSVNNTKAGKETEGVLDPKDSTKNTLQALITNEYNNSEMNYVASIKGLKNWYDNDDSLRPEIDEDGHTSDIKLTLKRTANAQSGADNKYDSSDSGDIYSSYTYKNEEIDVKWTKNLDNTWNYTITPKTDSSDVSTVFPQFAPNGMPFVYTVTESLKDGSVVKKNYRIQNGTSSRTASNGNIAADKSLTLTTVLENTMVGSIKVTKQWNDNYDQYTIREPAVQVELWRTKLVDSNRTWEYITTGTIGESLEWSYSKANLGDAYKYLALTDNAGKPYEYVVIEVGIQAAEIPSGSPIGSKDETGKTHYTSTDGAKTVNYYKYEGDLVYYYQIYPTPEETSKTKDQALLELVNNDHNTEYESYSINNPQGITTITPANTSASVKVTNALSGVTNLSVNKTWSDWDKEGTSYDKYAYRPDHIRVALLYRNVADTSKSDVINNPAESDKSTGWNYVRDSKNGTIYTKDIAKKTDGTYAFSFENLPYNKTIGRVEYCAIEIDDHFTADGAEDVKMLPDENTYSLAPSSDTSSVLYDSYKVEYKNEFNTPQDKNTVYSTTITNTLVKHEAITVNKLRPAQYDGDVKIELYSDNFSGGVADENPDASALKKITIAETADSAIALSKDTANSTEKLNRYTATIDDLPKYNCDGKLIAYYIKEVERKATDGTEYYPTFYKAGSDASSPEGSGYDFYCPVKNNEVDTIYIVNLPLTDIVVTKEWKDQNNNDLTASGVDKYQVVPNSVDVKLQRKESTTVASGSDNWSDVVGKDVHPYRANISYATSGTDSEIAVANNSNPVALTLKASTSAGQVVGSRTKWSAAVTRLPQYYVSDVTSDGLPTINEYEYRFIEQSMTYGTGTEAKKVTVDNATNPTKNGTFDISAISYKNAQSSGTLDASDKKYFDTVITNKLVVNSLNIKKTWEDDLETNRPSTGVPVKVNFYNTNAGDPSTCYKKDTVFNIDSTSWKTEITDLPARDIYGNAVKYTVSENIVSGYEKAENASATASSDSDVVTITNKSINLILKKVDESGNALPGAYFALKDTTSSATKHFVHLPEGIADSKKQTYYDGTTDTSGIISDNDGDGTIKIIGQLIPGHTYEVTEEHAPLGYVRMNGVIATVEVDENGKLTITNNASAAGVKLLSGAGTEISNTSATTVDNGANLTICVPNKVTEIQIFKYTQRDGTTEKVALADAQLKITRVDSDENYTWTTDASGRITFKTDKAVDSDTTPSLREDSLYMLEEVAVPKTSGNQPIYQLAKPVYFRLIGQDIANYGEPGKNTKIVLYEENGDILQKADGFEYTADEMVAQFGANVTEENGIYAVNMIDKDDFRVFLKLRKYDTKNYDYTKADTTKAISLLVDASGKTPLAGISFNLEKKNDDETYTKVGTYTTNDDGYLVGIDDSNKTKPSDNAYANTLMITKRGTYRIVEVKKPGYFYTADSSNINTNEVYTSADFTVEEDDCGKFIIPAMNTIDTAKIIEVAENESNIGVDNNRKSGSVTITKKDKDSEITLDGMHFALYYQESEAADASKGFISNVLNKFEETLANAFHFITGHRYDYYTLSEAATSVDTGKLVINDLPWGFYYLVEIDRTSGVHDEYKLSKADLDQREKYAFTITANNADNPIPLTADATNTITNAKTQFTFYKYGYKNGSNVKEQASALSGGTYEIHRVNGEAIAAEACKFFIDPTKSADADKVSSFSITDATKGVTIYGLSGGSTAEGVKYCLKEVKAPYGYILDEKPVYFTMNKYGEIGDITSGTLSNAENKNYAIAKKGESFVDGSLKLYNAPINLEIEKENSVDSNTKLKGAIFELTPVNTGAVGEAEKDYFKDGLPSHTYTTDEAGKLVIDSVVSGCSYYLQEKKAPAGYRINNQKYQLTVDEKGEITSFTKVEPIVDMESMKLVTLNADKKSITAKNERLDFTIKKVSAVNESEGLAGTQFEMSDITEGASAPYFAGEFASGEARTITLTAKEAGVINLVGTLIDGHTYTLKETKSKDGYTRREGVIATFVADATGITCTNNGVDDTTIIIDNSDTKTITIKNKETQIVVDKLNQNGEPLPGAMLEIEEKAAGTWSSVNTNIFAWDTTNADVSKTVKGLVEGKLYRIKESECPIGYAHDVKNSGFTYFKLVAVSQSNYNTANSRIVLCNQDGNALKNGEAAITDLYDARIIEENGTVHLQIINHEISVPVSLKKVDNATIPASVAGVEVTITGTANKGNIELTEYGKTDSDGILWEKATDGTISTKMIMLPEGSYKFVETKVPANIYLESTEHSFDVTAVDYKAYINSLDGAESQRLVRDINDQSGDITKRMTTLSGMSSLVNKLFKAKVSLTKSDVEVYSATDTQGNKTGLKDVEFYLYEKSSDSSWTRINAELKYVTKENGKVYTRNNEDVETEGITIDHKGTYRLVEKVNLGYQVDYEATGNAGPDGVDNSEFSQIRQFTLTDANFVEKSSEIVLPEMSNIRKTGSITFTKEDAVDSQALDGAKFVLYKKNADSKTIYGKVVDGINKVLMFVTGTNYAYNKWIDFSGVPTADNMVELDIAGDAASQGTITLSNLPWGEYILVEVVAPTGYHLESADNDNILNSYSFAVTRDTFELMTVQLKKLKDNSDVAENRVENALNQFTFEKWGVETLADKTDAKALSGGKFEILDKEDHDKPKMLTVSDDGQKVRINSSGTQNYFEMPADGNIIIEGLAGGIFNKHLYEINEVVAPNGYEKNGNILFTMDSYGKLEKVPTEKYSNAEITEGVDTAVVKMYDQEVEISLQKTDLEHNADDDRYAIAGAEFAISPADGSSFVDGTSSKHTFTTDENGIFSLKNLLITDHKYLLKETKAPNGYLLNEKEYLISVDHESKITITNSDGSAVDEEIKLSDNGKRIYFADQREYVQLEIEKVFNESTLAEGFGAYFEESIRPKSIDVTLYKRHVDDAADVSGEQIADAVTLSKDNEWKAQPVSWSKLPTYDVIEAEGVYSLVKNLYSLSEEGSLPNFLYNYETIVDESKVSEGKYKLTLTNTIKDDLYSSFGYLKIEKESIGGPVSEIFNIKISTYAQDGANKYEFGAYAGTYDVYKAENNTIVSSNNAITAEGYVQISTNQYAIIKLPVGIGYTVEEILSDDEESNKKEYTVSYVHEGTNSDESVSDVIEASHNSTSNADTVKIVNTAVIYTKIENETRTENADQKAVALGGQVSIKPAVGEVVSEIEGVEFQENSLIVSWKPDENWKNDNSFSITYQEYSADNEPQKTLYVENYLMEDGSLITDTDAPCYSELKSRYGSFTIKMVDGIIYLELNDTINGMPFLNIAKVNFVPTIAVFNTTPNDVGGKVRVESGTFNAISDGSKEDDGADRYVQSTVYAQADDGYVVDLEHLSVGNVGTQNGTYSENTNAVEMNLTAKSSFSVQILYNSPMQEITSKNTKLIYRNNETEDGIVYTIEGKLEILEKNEFGEATKIMLVVDDHGNFIPIDIGIPFKPASKKTNRTSGSDEQNEDSQDTQNTQKLPRITKEVTAESAADEKNAGVPRTDDTTPIGLLTAFGFTFVMLGSTMLMTLTGRRRRRKK